MFRTKDSCLQLNGKKGKRRFFPCGGTLRSQVCNTMGGKKASSPMAILCPFQDENPLLSNGLQSFLIFCHFTFPMAFSSSTNIIHLPISISPSNSSSNSNNYNSAASLYTRRCPPPAAKHQRYLCVKCNGSNKSWVPGKDDNDNDKTLKRVHKLYEVIKNKNMNQVYEVIADELPDAYNSIPAIRVFRAILVISQKIPSTSFSFSSSVDNGLLCMCCSQCWNSSLISPRPS